MALLDLSSGFPEVDLLDESEYGYHFSRVSSIYWVIYHSRVRLYPGKSVASAINLPEAAGNDDIAEQDPSLEQCITGEVPGMETEQEFAWDPYQN
ncbi:hypothetical protein RHMOL_Rhmol01G0282700 [Rhododendron molle]|uniref:Uncharacterized protein n=1 Tax=Rhododendron molle TaxID=49168 RepID=A0ACC0Q624_RHOML|nr:hypothetical protein RHMOL_Rhmol01G0282700 [Rhododendron molle]